VYPDWEEKYPLPIVTTLEREVLEHIPLIIDTGVPSKVPPLFRLGGMART
jgi:hypothetical protein